MLRSTFRRLLLGLALLVSIGAVFWVTQSTEREVHEERDATGATVAMESDPSDELQRASSSTTRVPVEAVEPAPEAAPLFGIFGRGKPRAKGFVQGFIQLDREDADVLCEVNAYKSRDYPWSQYKVEVQGGGSFTLKGPPGKTLDLRVRASGHGAAYIPEVTVSDPATLLAEPIQLRGPGSLRLQALDGDGKPTIGMRVSARHAGEDSVRRELWLSGNGLLQDNVVTDSGGRAELRGLAPGAYTLTTSVWEGGYEWSSEVSLAPAPVLADGRTIEIRHARPQILVRLEGLSADESVYSQHSNHFRRLLWSSSLTIDAARIDEQAQLYEERSNQFGRCSATSMRAQARGIPCQDGALVFFPQPNVPFQLSALSGVSANDSKQYRLAEGSGRLEVVIEPNDNTPLATLAIDGVAHLEGSHYLRLVHPQSGQVLARVSTTGVTALENLSIPAGTYALHVKAHLRRSSTIGSANTLVRQLVQLDAGETLVFPLPLAPTIDPNVPDFWR